MLSNDDTRATKLRDMLGELDVQLETSECVEVISILESDSSRVTETKGTRAGKELFTAEDLLIAEQYLDEFVEAVFEINYEKFTRRYEEKYLVNIPEP